MISKRGTKHLQTLGFTNIQVIKGMYGFYLRDTRYLSQIGGAPCRNTWLEAIQDALDGKLPQPLAPEEEREMRTNHADTNA